MISIKGNSISMTRGDTLILNVSLTKDGVAYVPAAEDVILFAVKHPEMIAGRTEYADAEPIISKVIDNETMQMKLDPEDTKEFGFGSYVYDMSITYANGDVDTFIPPSGFTLTPEVG